LKLNYFRITAGRALTA